MFRVVCALAAFLTFAPPSLDVDATAFALAFRAGKADQFKNTQVSGVGTNFHGAITERLADGSTRTSLVITLGAVDPDGRLAPLNSWDDFLAAERPDGLRILRCVRRPGAHDCTSTAGRGPGRQP
jgi:hypothetical protein